MNETDNQEYVSLKTLASTIGMDRSSLRRYLVREDIPTERRRMPDSNNQVCLAVRSDIAEEVIQERLAGGYIETDTGDTLRIGLFYLVQLVPELAPERVKMGFTSSLSERMQQHQTAAPTARVLKAWPCRRTWEATVIDYLAACACQHIANEVYECSDLTGLVENADRLFSLLPEPTAEIAVSPHSPRSQS